MRVAHIITRLIVGGAQENTILNCADLIHTFGDEVLLVTGPGLGPEGSLEADAIGRGIPVQLIPSLQRAVHPWRDARSYYALKSTLRNFGPDVVHTHSGKAGLLGRSAAWQLGIGAIVHTVHGAPFHVYQNVLARRILRRCEIVGARRCHAIISVADAMTDQMVAAGVAERDKFTTIYSGMQIESFFEAARQRDEVRRRLGLAPEDIVVAKVARLFHLKGHDDLLAAAVSACGQCARLRFLLVGDGILRESIEARIRQARLEARIRCVGRVPPADIPGLLAASDLVVHTSLREGLARVLPQALLSGLPAISYDIDGAREVIINDETGYLVTPGDVTGLTARILQLAGNASLRQSLGARGRQRCAKIFAHAAMTRQIRALYQRLLERCSASTR